MVPRWLLLVQWGEGKRVRCLLLLIIAGSGPTDRDGNNPADGHNDSLKKLAQNLARHGIASLRYDKRGVAASRTATPDERDLSVERYVADAEGWAGLLRDDPRFDRLILIGHSEGALIASLAAARPDLHTGEVRLMPVVAWEVFYFRGDAWTNPLSSVGSGAPAATLPEQPARPTGVPTYRTPRPPARTTTNTSTSSTARSTSPSPLPAVAALPPLPDLPGTGTPEEVSTTPPARALFPMPDLPTGTTGRDDPADPPSPAVPPPSPAVATPDNAPPPNATEADSNTVNPPPALPPSADQKLTEVFGDTIHRNDGRHLNGGIADDQCWQR